MITRVNMLILMQSDLQKAVDFYQTLGGLKLKFHLKKQWAEFQLGDLKVGLCPTEKELEPRRTGIVLEIDNVHDFYQTYENKLHFVSEPLQKVHGIMVSVQDPGGNIIDLYQPTPEKLQELIKKTKQQGCCKDDQVEQDGCCRS